MGAAVGIQPLGSVTATGKVTLGSDGGNWGHREEERWEKGVLCFSHLEVTQWGHLCVPPQGQEEGKVNLDEGWRRGGSAADPGAGASSAISRASCFGLVPIFVSPLEKQLTKGLC